MEHNHDPSTTQTPLCVDLHSLYADGIKWHARNKKNFVEKTEITLTAFEDEAVKYLTSLHVVIVNEGNITQLY